MNFFIQKIYQNDTQLYTFFYQNDTSKSNVIFLKKYICKYIHMINIMTNLSKYNNLNYVFIEGGGDVCKNEKVF